MLKTVITLVTKYVTSISVVQGLGLDPSSCGVVASDLKPAFPINVIVKYADDTYLLVPASHRSCVLAELTQISAKALTNNLDLNTSKYREMLLHCRAGFSSLPQ